MHELAIGIPIHAIMMQAYSYTYAHHFCASITLTWLMPSAQSKRPRFASFKKYIRMIAALYDSLYILYNYYMDSRRLNFVSFGLSYVEPSLESRI